MGFIRWFYSSRVCFVICAAAVFLSAQSVSADRAGIRVRADSPYRVYLNGREIYEGEAGTEADIDLFIRGGENVIAVEVQNGAAGLDLEAPRHDSGRARWRMGEPGPEAVDPATDDRNWEIAPEREDNAGRIFGKEGEPSVLRHTLLWEETMIWPDQDPALHIARDSNQMVIVTMAGLEGKRLEDWTLYFAVPEEFDLIGATGYYGQNDFTLSPAGEKEIDGRRLHVAKVHNSKPVVTGRHQIYSRVDLFVRYREEYAGELADDAAFVYWTEANEGTLTESRQHMPVKVIPGIDGRQPGEFVWIMWSSFMNAMDDNAMKEAVFETFKAAGINENMPGCEFTMGIRDEYGIGLLRLINFTWGGLQMGTYLEENPEEILVKMDGSDDNSRMCTTAMLEDSWDAVHEVLEGRVTINEQAFDVIKYDYESTPLGDGNHSCYCGRCLSRFREFAGIPGEVELDGEKVNSEYDDEWVDFMAWRVAEMFALFKESIHEISPGTKFEVYSGYGTVENARRYGVNWEYVGKLNAVDRASMGYGRPVDRIDTTLEVLGNIPATFGIIHQPWTLRVGDMGTKTPFTRALLLRRALDSTGGVLLYYLHPMEGRSWNAVADVSRVVAEFEELFLRGELSALGNFDEASVQVVSGGDDVLVALMNTSGRSMDFRIPMPDGTGPGYEFYSGERVSAGETVEVQLEPGGIKVYVFKR